MFMIKNLKNEEIIVKNSNFEYVNKIFEKLENKKDYDFSFDGEDIRIYQYLMENLTTENLVSIAKDLNNYDSSFPEIANSSEDLKELLEIYFSDKMELVKSIINSDININDDIFVINEDNTISSYSNEEWKEEINQYYKTDIIENYLYNIGKNIDLKYYNQAKEKLNI